MPVKKFLSPTIYPKDRSLTRTWFVQYHTEDWINGGLKKEKYYGQINKGTTVDEREQIALQYIGMMHRGERLPNYQGSRSLSKPSQHRHNTDLLYCCDRYLLTIHDNLLTGEIRIGTYRSYKTMFSCFKQWVIRQGLERIALGGFTEDNAEDFCRYLKFEKKLGGATYNKYLTRLGKLWHKYRKQLGEVNPWADIPRRKKGTKHMEHYPDAIQQAIKEGLPDYNPLVWIALQCVYYGAIRPQSELRLLQRKHLNVEQGTVHVPAHISKNGKDRYVNLYRKLIEQIVNAGLMEGDSEGYLFPRKNDATKPIGKNYFARKFDAFRKAQGIDSIYKLYGSKHTAGHKLSKKYSPYIAKEQFDHTSMSITEGYTGGMAKEELAFLQTDFPEFG